MRKPEIQPLIPLIRAIVNIIPPLLLAQRKPLLLPPLVLQDIVSFCAEEAQQHENVDGDEDGVAAVVERGVVGAVDVGGDDVAELDGYCRRRLVGQGLERFER